VYPRILQNDPEHDRRLIVRAWGWNKVSRNYILRTDEAGDGSNAANFSRAEMDTDTKTSCFNRGIS